MYSSVVIRDSVKIALLIASLNDLQLLACNIQNAYLTADCQEKIYKMAGSEFGSGRGRNDNGDTESPLWTKIKRRLSVQSTSCGDLYIYTLFTMIQVQYAT